MLCSVRCLPLAAGVRDQISNIISSSCNKVRDLVFAILITNSGEPYVVASVVLTYLKKTALLNDLYLRIGQLITMVRMKKYFLHPGDLHLIFNLVYSSESFKVGMTKSFER